MPSDAARRDGAGHAGAGNAGAGHADAGYVGKAGEGYDPVRSGRQFRSQRAAWRLVGVGVIVGVALAAPRLAGHHAGAPGNPWAGVLGIAFVVLLLVAFVVRRTAVVLAPAEGAPASTPPADEATVEPTGKSTHESTDEGGTVICCSGGGIKSASFAMGALERLHKAGVWDTAKAVVAVSGGGYMAAAWSAAAHCSSDGEPKWSKEQVTALRSRTNYIASSGRVRFDLAGSILLGVVVNVLILGGPIVTLAWLVGGYALDTGLASTEEATRMTFDGDTLWVLAPAAVLVLIAVLAFISNRYRWGADTSAARGRTRVLTAYWFVVAGRAHRDDSERIRFFAEMPNTILGIAAGYTLAVPLLIWTATRLDAVSVQGLTDLLNYLWDHKDQISWGLGILVTMAGLSHSGAKAPPKASGPVWTAWRMFRRQIAPWVAVAIVAGFGYWGAALVTAREIHEPLTGWWAAAAAAAVLVLPLLVRLTGSANLTSLFLFYRDRLAYAYLAPACGPDADDNRPEDIALADVTFQRQGPAPAFGVVPPRRPALALVATANAYGAGFLPTGRNGTPFLLSDTVVGYPIPMGRYPGRLTAAAGYSLDRGGPITVADAMAISGAAVSPQAGRESKNLGGYRLLLALANVRLGVWARNPYYVGAPLSGRTRFQRACLRLNDLLDRPSPLHVVAEAVGTLRLDDSFVYLTDGGHYDNLGLVAALRRRPDTIYLLDGTGDAEDTFAAVGDAMATARMDLDVEISGFDPTLLTRGDARHPASAWTTMRATVGSGAKRRECTIVYVKALLPAGFTFDLYAYQDRNPGFPTGLDRIEVLDEFDFEAYRQLGWCATDSALAGAGVPAAHEPSRSPEAG